MMATTRIGSWAARVGIAALCLWGLACGGGTEPGDEIRLQTDLGDHTHPITTDSTLAQRYFDQGLILTFGFNHELAVLSFREAAVHDPNCAMCFWGIALASGPNINAPMGPEGGAAAWEALGEAQARLEYASETERAYIDALSKRYAEDPEAPRGPLDRAYADAMAELHARYPDDVDAATLYAEALMDLYPWDYWDDEGSPREHTGAIVAALEKVMTADPDHPGALHFYIHVMEKLTPELAEPAADRLGPLVPVAGHLVHMPSHIYLRVGRYHDAVATNQQAALADEDYIAQCNAQGFYPAAYYPHNIHFLWYSAMMEGRRALAIESAEKLHSKVPVDMARQFGAIQAYLAVPSYTFVRFGMWQEALAVPEPDEGLVIAAFMRHYGRGVAHAAIGDTESAGAELEAMQAILDSGKFRAQMDRQGDIGDILASIASSLVRARIARAKGDADAEVQQLRDAVASQDSLPYTEPPYWHYPIRQSLGSALLRLGDAAGAAQAFAEDLDNFPKNGWSLHGLAEARRALGEPTEELEAAHRDAWQYADIEPTAGAE